MTNLSRTDKETKLSQLYVDRLFRLNKKIKSRRVDCKEISKCYKIVVTTEAAPSEAVHCMKSVQIWSFSGPYFPVCGLNTEIYFVNLRIQS